MGSERVVVGVIVSGIIVIRVGTIVVVIVVVVT